MTPGVRILFIDMNSFYASVEEQDNPGFRGKPTIVVPVMADTSCAIAASYQAKKLGIKTGTPVAEAKTIAPNLNVVLARPSRYVEIHNQILTILNTIFTKVKPLSIDEFACYLPVDNASEEFGDQKFITQVGNTITFFTRDFVVAGDEPTKAKVDESLEILKMKKLAGLLTEGEYAKALLNNINENTIPSVVDILKDPKLGLKHFAKLDAYDTKFKLKDDSEAVKKNPQLKGKEVEITGYYDPRENLLTIRSGNASVNVYPEEVEIIASTYTDNKEDYFKKNPKG